MEKKKGGAFEDVTLLFLKAIFSELNYRITKERSQYSGTQDGYDVLIEIVDPKTYKSYRIFSECKDYKTTLSYSEALMKIPQIVSAQEQIDLLLFISPHENFKNPHEEFKLENFYHTISYRCPVAFLTPNEKVQRYFSLYPDLYKIVYNNDIDNLPSNLRTELLQDFEAFIFSDRNLKKIVIDEIDRFNYIGNIEEANNVLQRTVRIRDQQDFFEFKDYVTLIEQIQKSDLGVVLLGSPGIGKSFELRQLAYQLWKNRDSLYAIPKFVSLRDTNKDVSIEIDLLPKDWQYIQNLVIILDGLDELSDNKDFGNKLRSFINKYHETIKRNKLRFVISCRTSIYYKSIKGLEGFDICYLNEVSEDKAISFLEIEYGLNIKDNLTLNSANNRFILRNPFYLVLLGENFKDTGELLLNKSKLIEQYEERRLKEDENEKFRNINHDKDEVRVQSKKIALMMEAMKQTVITNGQVLGALGNSNNLSLNPFLHNEKENYWSFEHKNIQEYFVANILAKMDFNSILRFIKIDDSTPKVHPSWYNVVTFLLDSNIDNVLHDKLVSWIVANDVEIIFGSDHERISDALKATIFQELFIKYCVEDTLWLDDNVMIAEFANITANIDFLINQSKSKSNHTRARITALELLAQMKHDGAQLNSIKDVVLQIIEELKTGEENVIYLMKEALDLVSASPLRLDEEFYNALLQELRQYDYKEVVKGLLRGMPNNVLAQNLEFLMEIFEKSIGKKKWLYPAKVNSILSTKEILLQKFEQVNNAEFLLEVCELILNYKQRSHIQDEILEGFYSHLSTFFDVHAEYKERIAILIASAVSNYKIHHHGNERVYVISLIKELNIEVTIFEEILKEERIGYGERQFLIELIDDVSISDIAALFTIQKVPDIFLKNFRNDLIIKNEELARTFESLISENVDIEFAESISEIVEVAQKKVVKNRSQMEFDVLFDNEMSVQQIALIYNSYNASDLSYSDIVKLDEKFYDIDELHEKVSWNAKRLIQSILKRKYNAGEKLNIMDLPAELENWDNYRMLDAAHSIEDVQKGYIHISEKQIAVIKNWCIQNTDRVKTAYQNSRKRDKWKSKDFEIFRSIYSIQKHFKFHLDEELLLNFIYFSRMNYNNEFTLNYLEGIVQASKVKQYIMSILKEGVENDELIFCVDYCIKNNIDFESIPYDIKGQVRILSQQDSSVIPINLIRIALSNDISFLKECLNIEWYTSGNRYFLQTIFDRLIEKNEKESVSTFILSQSHELINKNILDNQNIIYYLIIANNESGFKMLKESLERTPEDLNKTKNGFDQSISERHTNRQSIPYLVQIMEAILSLNVKKFDRFFDPEVMASQTILNICKVQDTAFCQYVMEQLKQIDTEMFKKKGKDVFYVNKLKKDIFEIAYSKLSNPWGYKEVLQYVKENEFIFY